MTQSLPEKMNIPASSQDILPTMYDLKSEDAEEPGLPDEYHLLQPRLLGDTFHPTKYPEDRIFVASDLNLYYNHEQTSWYKRPDWFAVLGVDRLYNNQELRMSYVVWQEENTPFIVVELLSPGTEKEDLGRSSRKENQPPTKWEVYEQILSVPYYIVFDRYTNHLRAFQLTGRQYKELSVPKRQVWLKEIQIGLGLWQGTYQGVTRQWLRWYDAQGNWILTEAEKERARANRLAEYLRQMGIDPEDI